MQVNKKKVTMVGALAASALVAGSFASNASAPGEKSGSSRVVHTEAELYPINNSGATGEAQVRVKGKKLRIELTAKGLAKNLPHAQHIHYGEQARNECGSVRDDANGDFRLETLEAAPAYGPVRVSLTTKGDTSPASALAVDRFPIAPKGKVDYDRRTKTQRDLAKAIRQGEAVVVVHGVDYNNNGTYDFDSAGASDLTDTLPAEATDPALCGVLKVDKHH